MHALSLRHPLGQFSPFPFLTAPSFDFLNERLRREVLEERRKRRREGEREREIYGQFIGINQAKALG